MTLVFPDSLSKSSLNTAPSVEDVPMPINGSIRQLPATSNPLSPLSQDSTLAFAVPSNEAEHFLNLIQELPNRGNQIPRQDEEEATHMPGRWVIKAPREAGSTPANPAGFSVTSSWTRFVDLVKVSCTSFNSATT